MKKTLLLIVPLITAGLLCGCKSGSGSTSTSVESISVSTIDPTTTYNVVYNYNAPGTTNVETTAVIYTKLTKPADPAAREGWTWSGEWARNAAGGLVWNFNTDTVTPDDVIFDTLTLYAVWDMAK